MRVVLAYNTTRSMVEPGRAEVISSFANTEKVGEIAQIIRDLGHDVEIREADGSLTSLRPKDVDLIFNLACGVQGPHSQAYVPAVAASLGIPCTGSDTLTTALCQDKFSLKACLGPLGAPTPEGQIFYSLEEVEAAELTLPLFLKPNSGVLHEGIAPESVCVTEEGVKNFAEILFSAGYSPVLAEDFASGQPVSVVAWEINGEWEADTPRFSDSGEESSTSELLDLTCLFAHNLGCRDWVRIDFCVEPRKAEETPHWQLIEIETIPDIACEWSISNLNHDLPEICRRLMSRWI